MYNKIREKAKIKKNGDRSNKYTSISIGFSIISYLVILFISFLVGHSILYVFILDMVAGMILLVGLAAMVSDEIDYNKIKFTTDDSIAFIFIAFLYDLFWFYSIVFDYNLYFLFVSIMVSMVLYISLFTYYKTLTIEKGLMAWQRNKK